MPKTIRALDRGLRVLTALGQADEPLGLAALHQLTGLEKSTLLRILATLSERGWVTQGLADRRYRLARRMTALGERQTTVELMAELALPTLRELHDVFGWPSDLCIQEGAAMRVIESSRSLGGRVMHCNVLDFTPCLLRSAVGRAYLASCDEAQRERLLRKLLALGGPVAELASNRGFLRALLAEADGLGHSRRVPGERFMASGREAAHDAIAVPIRVGSEVSACLSLVYFSGAQDVDEAALSRGLRRAATRLSAAYAAHRCM